MKRMLLLVASLFSLCSSAQIARDGLSVGLGLGPYSNGQASGGFALGGELIARQGKWMTSLTYTNLIDLAILKGPVENGQLLGVLVGRYHDLGKHTRVYYQGGLTANIRTKREDLIHEGIGDLYSTRSFTTIGIPLRVGANVIIGNWLSLGTQFYANFSAEEALFTLPFLYIEVGRIR